MVRFNPAREPTSPLVSSTAESGVTARMCVRSRSIESRQELAIAPGNANTSDRQELSCLNAKQGVSRHDGGQGRREDMSSAGPDLGRRTDHFLQYKGEIQSCCRAWSGSAGGHWSSPGVLPVIVPGVATQLCWISTFGSMRNDANNADDHDVVGRMCVHICPEGDYLNQVIVVQIGRAIATQVAESPLVKTTRGRDVYGCSVTHSGAGLHMAGTMSGPE